jgi:hypothetical protein
MSVVCILTARKNSKGYPGKNLLEIRGKKLFEWVALEESKSKLIEKFFVNTDSFEIISKLSELGWNAIPRPEKLANDNALSEDVFIQSLEWLNKNNSSEIHILVLLMANSPTFTFNEIDKAIDILRNNPTYDSAVTVSRYNMWSPVRARRIRVDGLLEPFVPLSSFGKMDEFTSGRDSQGDVWFADMGFSVVRAKNLQEIKSGQLPQRWMGQNIYPICHEGGLDLDYPYQVGQIEWWIDNQLKNSGDKSIF